MNSLTPPATTRPDKRGLSLVEHYTTECSGGLTFYVYLRLDKLTGRWRLTPHSDPSEKRLQVERKGFVFKHWVDESDIIYKLDSEEVAQFHANRKCVTA